MPAGQWKIYRTRFLVKAMRLSSCISIADASGKLVVGEPGDYLIEGSDGTRRIARRDIFEDIYVELETPVALAHAG